VADASKELIAAFSAPFQILSSVETEQVTLMKRKSAQQQVESHPEWPEPEDFLLSTESSDPACIDQSETTMKRR
jgi:hypothetical protein